METLHKQLVKGFGHSDVSPAAMAYKMLHESTYVNESILGYAINYIIIMATYPVVPMHLAEVHEQCKQIYYSLQELGLTGEVGRQPLKRGEYLTT